MALQHEEDSSRLARRGQAHPVSSLVSACDIFHSVSVPNQVPS